MAQPALTPPPQMNGFVVSLPRGVILAGIVAPPEQVPGPLNLVGGAALTQGNAGGAVLRACELGLNADLTHLGAYDGVQLTEAQLSAERARFVACMGEAVKAATNASKGIFPPEVRPEDISVMVRTEQAGSAAAAASAAASAAGVYNQPIEAIPVSKTIVDSYQQFHGIRGQTPGIAM